MMKLVLNVEANGLKPTKIWVLVCKDIDTGEYHIFRNLNDDETEKQRAINLLEGCEVFIGHNILGYDLPVMARLLCEDFSSRYTSCVDTFILSKLIDYPRDKHSAEDYAVEFGMGYVPQVDYHRYSMELEEYCKRKVDISHRIYSKYYRYYSNPMHKKSIELEHSIQWIINTMEDYGFTIDTHKVNKYYTMVIDKLQELDNSILQEFVPTLRYIRTVTPKETKYGTISLSSIPKSMRSCVHELSVGCPFSYCEWSDFNPGSPKQVVDVLNKAGWKPTEKTKGHIETEREYSKLLRSRNKTPEIALTVKSLYDKLKNLEIYGWKVSEKNLNTLPKDAPASARLLSQRILYESRRKTLREWLDIVSDDGRIHGRFQGIGAWTHRMSHQKPNMANITNEFDIDGVKQLLGRELRQCWTVPKNRLLTGVDAEGIQLRIFAHYIDDQEFTYALVNGKKSEKTDAHSLNQQILGRPCKSRAAAKRFIFAFLLGAGIGKLAEILSCGQPEAQQALDRLYERYRGLETLKNTIIPADAKRGYFIGLDGRKVRIVGETEGTRRHLAMSGYLQCGEAVVVKTAATIFHPRLRDFDSYLVNIIHDEFQIETPNDFKVALEVAKIVAEAIKEAGVSLGLKCPLAGSYYNDDHHEYTIGRNWYETH